MLLTEFLVLIVIPLLEMEIERLVPVIVRSVMYCRSDSIRCSKDTLQALQILYSPALEIEGVTVELTKV